MSIVCPHCSTRWLLHQKACPTCGRDTNGNLPRTGFAFGAQQATDPAASPITDFDIVIAPDAAPPA